MAVVHTEEELQALCREWQGVMRLQDWDVAVQICRQRDMDTSDSQGRSIWLLEKKMAIVKVLDPSDWPGGPWPQDQEQTLVHELLHLHVAPFDAAEDSPAGIAQEQMIDAMASALVRLKREARSG